MKRRISRMGADGLAEAETLPMTEIRYALLSELGWTHHRAITRVGDSTTIGMLLGTEVDETDVEYSIMAECEQMFATKLLPYMPTKAELQFEIERARERTVLRKQKTSKKHKLLKGTKK